MERGGLDAAGEVGDELHPGDPWVAGLPAFRVTNQDAVDRQRLKDDKKRFPFGMPSVDSANYLWIQLFYSALNATGRAGFVMANSASDARGSELELRRKLIQSGAVDVMVTLSPNFFYTVTLPVTLWFLDKGKAKGTWDWETTSLFPSPGGQSHPDPVPYADASTSP